MTREVIDRKEEMAALEKDIAAYDAMKDELQRDYFGRWVIFHDEEFIGDYESFEEAAPESIKLFGLGPYLIREVGDNEPLTLPPSVPYNPIHG